MKRKSILVVMLAICAVLGLINSCEVGLGNSVDTQPPKVSITSPDKGAIIKNTFTIQGSAIDETFIKSVSVVLTSNSTKKTYGPFNATLDENKGTWQVVVNEFNNGKFVIPDGEYGITVTATDSASRTSVAESLYTIDNTPPVVVIKRPGLNDTFGRTIKITGDISDQSSLKALYFTPYRNVNGSLVKLCEPQVFANISGVGLELIVGKYFADTSDPTYDSTLDQAYKAIYNSETAGTQDVFCVIEVEDSAKEYNPPATRQISSTTSGNLSSGYYLYNEIYSQIYGASGYSLSNNDLVKIMSNSHENANLALDVKNYLETQKINSVSPSIDNISKFSLNPENAPIFSVSGYEVKDGNYTGIFNEAKITVSASQGRDQIAINGDTIRVVLIPAANPSDEIVIFESLKNINKETDSEKKAAMEALRNEAIIEDGDQFRVTTSIGNLSTGKKYEIKVQGEDLEGNFVEPEQNGIFGFRILSNNKPPAVTILNGTEDLAVSNKLNFTYEGTVESSAEEVFLSYKVSARNEKTGEDLGSIGPHEITIEDSSSTTRNWDLTISEDILNPIVPTEEGLYTYTVTFIAENGDDGQFTESSRRVYLDTQASVVKITSITPQVTANGKENNVNGTITVNGTVSDNYTLKNTVYNLYLGESTEPVLTAGNFGEATTFTFTIDTTASIFTDKTDLKIELVSTDTAGNESSKTIDSKASETVYIDQTTDLPGITFSNVNEETEAKENLFGMGSYTIYGT
ncbi:MAG: hypothetical protein IJ312_06430, partial [Treponema sp.]|nr:hypothetical protein [Treponema sp.]